MAVRSFFLHVPADSPLQRLHPLAKLFILLGVNIVAWVNESTLLMVLMIVGVLALYPVAKIPFRRLRRFFFLLFMVMQSITISYIVASRIPGRVVYFTYPWGTYLSDLTLVFAFTMVLRFFLMLVGSTLVLATTRDRDFIHAFRALRLPYALSFTVTLAFRTMSIFIEDFFKVKEAMILKGTDFDRGSMAERARKYVHVGIPLVVIALRRIIETTNAIEAKGFALTGRRTYYRVLPLRAADLAVCGLIILLLMVAVVGKLYWGWLTFPGWPFT